MAITGIDTIEGKQIIAAGAVSAKSAEMAYNDENGNPITGKLDASASGSLPYAHYNSATHAIVEDGITATPNYLALSGFLTAVPSQISANNLLGVNAGTLTTPQLTADSNGVNATGKGFISTNNTGTASLTYTNGLNIVNNGEGTASLTYTNGLNIVNNRGGRSASIDGFSGININAFNTSASVNYSGLNIKNNNQGSEVSISAKNGGKVYIDDKGASGLDGYGNVNWQVGGPAKQLVNAGGDPQPGIIMAPAPTSVSAQWTAMTRVSGNNTGLWAYAGPTASAPYAQFIGQNISIEYAPTNAHAGIGVGDVTAGIYTANNDPDKITWSLTGSVQKREIECDTATSAITAIAGSAIGGGGSTPAYGYTDNGLISSIDSSGLYATSALEAESANTVKDHGTLGYDLSSYLSQNTSYFYWMPANSPWTTADYATGIFSPLQYATGACLAMDNPATFKAYYKGNEWFVSNTVSNVGQMLRGEVHKTRGVHVSGATTAGYGFDLNISGVSGKNDTANNYNWKLERGYVSGNGAYGTWKYGHDEDAALRAVSSCDMHESAFEYDASDNITGYNGSAFAGGDVPEGVMVESAVEYNAVNEISGYNGSAIAQYGAEKQWLVHDDTLVHAANSAQYALGVNLSAVAQLLGVDETILFSGAGTSAANITEDIHNFNTVQLHVQHANYGPAQVITLNPETMDTTGYFAITRPRGGENLNVAYIRFEINQTGISAVNSKCIRFGTWTNTTATGSNVDINNAEDRNSIIKVIGIGRKQ